MVTSVENAIKPQYSSTVGHGISAATSQWTFAGDVADNFSNHVRQSVPLYDQGHDLMCRLSDYFIKNNSIVYDLGSSTGELLAKIADRHALKEGIQLIGIDAEEGMVNKANELSASRSSVRFEIGDVCQWDYEKSDLIISCYTIQFVYPSVRQNLLDKIYQSLNWGGAFLFFEKTRAPDARFQDISSGVYQDFKLENGFTPEEIVNKSRSLKGVLEPFSVQGNLDLLKRAGFVDIMTVMTYIPFTGFLAIK
jgi:tRNA (cmo5U34)-methyltransferase